MYRENYAGRSPSPVIVMEILTVKSLASRNDHRLY